MASDWESEVFRNPDGVDVAALFDDLHGDDASARYEAAAGVYWLAEFRPDQVAARSEELIPLIDGTRGPESGGSDGSGWVGGALGRIAAAYPDRWLRPLVDLLNADALPTRRAAARALTETARRNPERVAHHFPAVSDLVDDESPDLRREGVRVLTGIRSAHPGVRRLVPRVVELLRDKAVEREAAVFVYGFADEEPDAVRPEIDRLLDALERSPDRNLAVVRLLLRALALLGAEDPETVRPAAPVAKRLAERDEADISDPARELLAVLDA